MLLSKFLVVPIARIGRHASSIWSSPCVCLLFIREGSVFPAIWVMSLHADFVPRSPIFSGDSLGILHHSLPAVALPVTSTSHSKPQTRLSLILAVSSLPLASFLSLQCQVSWRSILHFFTQFHFNPRFTIVWLIPPTHKENCFHCDTWVLKSSSLYRLFIFLILLDLCIV